MKRAFNAIAVLLVLAAIVSTAGPAFAEDRLEPAQRSGTWAPKSGHAAAHAVIGGIYVPKVENLSSDSTGVFEGTLVWNFGLFKRIGLFGKHDVSRMWWANLSVLSFGHEVGARFLFSPHLVFEAAYLGHRIEYEWVDGNPFSVGGLGDHGAEAGLWTRFEPLPSIRIEGHLFGRRFQEPIRKSSFHYVDQIVFAAGLRATFMIFDGNSAELEMEALRVYRRGERRDGVEETTWNTTGSLIWRSFITRKLGILGGVFASNNWLCGIVPMLEYKRSMIDEPVIKLFTGFYFFI